MSSTVGTELFSKSDLPQQRLIDSDRRYFCAGAENTDLLNGTFSKLPGLTSQPGGCVFHSIQRLDRSLSGWLNELSEFFRKNHANLIRFYLHESDPKIESEILANDFTRVCEVGFGRNLQNNDSGRSVQVIERTAEHHQLYQDLIRTSETSPDGHSMNPREYCLLEESKIRAGYMIPYLAIENGKAIGAANLDLNNDFARVKNVLVASHLRGKRIGTNLVGHIMDVARKRGAKQIAAFALEDNQAAIGMYKACGFSEFCEQFEWTRKA
ncbi:GNAT family N-acetyltransferase [Pirellulaceae bacterium]|jgi:ribosomal protein S18 acetylase RimI-like enzyme|nr:GNAT family N-acetyltransferase [Pirellulaceae bacterium]